MKISLVFQNYSFGFLFYHTRLCLSVYFKYKVNGKLVRIRKHSAGFGHCYLFLEIAKIYSSSKNLVCDSEVKK